MSVRYSVLVCCLVVLTHALAQPPDAQDDDRGTAGKRHRTIYRLDGARTHKHTTYLGAHAMSTLARHLQCVSGCTTCTLTVMPHCDTTTSVALFDGGHSCAAPIVQ